MDKLRIFWVLFTIVTVRSAFGKIYFEGMDYPPVLQEAKKPAQETANQAHSVQTRYQSGPVVQTAGKNDSLLPSANRPMPAVNHQNQPGSQPLPATNHQNPPGSQPLPAVNYQNPPGRQPLPAVNYQNPPERQPLPAVNYQNPPGSQPLPAANHQNPAAPGSQPSPAITNLHHLLSGPNSANPSEPALKASMLKYIGRGLTEMTLQMQRVLSEKKSNVFFAPVSIASALALLLLAAKGQTAKQIANCLGFPVGDDLSYREEETHQLLGLFFNELKSGTSNISSQLALANGIFIQNGLLIKPQFRNIVTAAYKSDVYSVDFKNKRTDPSIAINYWVANRTHGRIKSVLGEPLPPSTVAVLINAIYFNGNWEYPFYHTSIRKFYVTPKEAILIPMMHNEAKVPFLMDKEAGFKMIGLPYKGDEHLMYSIIPDGDLDTFIGTLTADRIYDLINRTVEEMTIILFPKMKLTMEIDLHTTLDRLGVKDVFIPSKADLSSLAKGVSVSKAVHKAEIDVNEMGTTASAITLVSMIRASVHPTFVVSKPFVFFIYHKPTQAITFWGTVYKPTL